MRQMQIECGDVVQARGITFITALLLTMKALRALAIEANYLLKSPHYSYNFLAPFL